MSTSEARAQNLKLTLWSGKRRACAAVKRSGEPCGSWAVNATERCVVHGGNSPRTVADYQRQFRAHVAEVIDFLIETVRDPLASDEVRVKAALAICDRAGVGPFAKLEVEHQHSHKLELRKLTREELIARIEDRLVSFKGKALAADVVDAEVLPSPTTPAEDPASRIPVEDVPRLLREVDEKLAAVSDPEERTRYLGMRGLLESRLITEPSTTNQQP